MALITKIGRVSKERPTIHVVAECACSIFEVNGRRILQLDTYGSANRQLKGQISQSLQFDKSSAAMLRGLLDELLIS